jgi:hypothetical protein
MSIRIQVGQVLSDLRQEPVLRAGQDRWFFSPSVHSFSSARYYKFIFAGINASPLFKKLWKSKILHKQKVFVWLFLVDRLNTRDMKDIRQWKLDSGVNCVMCNNALRETRDHLFSTAPLHKDVGVD